MEAKVVSDPWSEVEQIEVGGHSIEYSGKDSSGYCYNHQSFDCELTEEEQEAVNNV